MTLLDNATTIHYLLALSPIFVVLVLMVGFRWGGDKAGVAAWLVAFAVALLFFGADIHIVATSQLKGLMLTLFVLYIIWTALGLFNVVKESGAINVIGQGIMRLTADRVLQMLVLAWVFSAFLEGIAGFGVPIAVVSPLLIGMGFSPVAAVVAVTVGHAWAIALGDVGVPFDALIAVSNVSGQALAPWTVGLVGVACLGCGLAAAHSYGGFRSLSHALPAIVLVGAAMIATLFGLTMAGVWNLAGFVAGMVGLGVSILVSQLGLYRNKSPQANEAPAPPEANRDRRRMSFLLAISGYIILIVIVASAELVPVIHAWLNTVGIEIPLQGTQTTLGWTVEPQMSKRINLFGHPGALIAYSAVAAFTLYALSGQYRKGAAGRICSNTVQSALRSSIGIASMVGFAMIMEQTGMTYLLAVGLSQTVQVLFPILSPFIGVLGTFMTGSNTNSNVVFGGLQLQTAQLLSLPAAVILAAQNTGGSLGSMIAPAKIIVGCSTAGLAGEEGQVLRRTLGYGFLVTLVIGLIAWLLIR